MKSHGSLLNIIGKGNSESYNGDSATIEGIKSSLDSNTVKKIHKLFLIPEVLSKNIKLEINPPCEGGILTLMCNDHNLDKKRVEKGITRLKKAHLRLEKSN